MSSPELVWGADFDAEVSTIHVVSQEQIARLRWVATNFEQLHEIVVLSVNITAHGYGRIHFQQVGLRL